MFRDGDDMQMGHIFTNYVLWSEGSLTLDLVAI